MGKQPDNPLPAGLVGNTPGLFVTATDTGVGKTIVAGALAMIHRLHRKRVGVLKPIATGCRRARGAGGVPLVEGELVSSDAEFLAWSADSNQSLVTINPVRYAEPLAPLVAARRAGRPIDFDAIVESAERVAADSDLIIVEGIGGLLVPITRKLTVLDLAEAFALPLLIVARPALGTLNHTLLTVQAARHRGLKVAAIAVNRYNPHSADLSEESNPAVLAELTRLPVVCVPDDAETHVEPTPAIGNDVLFACRQIVL